MEIFWLAAAVVSAVVIAYAFFVKELDEHPAVLSLPFMAFIMFLIRRWFRKRIERDKNDDPNR